MEETEDQEPETDESDVQGDTTEFQDKDKEEEEEEEEEESKPGDESDMSYYGSQRWRCDVCQTWKQYKGEEHPFNCSLCMNKTELYFGFFKCHHLLPLCLLGPRLSLISVENDDQQPQFKC